jgi:hypothetical protein
MKKSRTPRKCKHCGVKGRIIDKKLYGWHDPEWHLLRKGREQRGHALLKEMAIDILEGMEKPLRREMVGGIYAARKKQKGKSS